MSFSVQLFTFSKNANSTLQPPTNSGVTLNCVLRDNCSIQNPVLIVQVTTYPQYNYAAIPEFGRYYYITDWVFLYDEMWEIHMQVDVMATYKEPIGNALCYILRAADDKQGDITDTTYPITATNNILNVNCGEAWNKDDYFVIGVAGDVTSYYGFSSFNNMQSFFSDILSENYITEAVGTNWQDVFPGAKLQANVMQYITSLMWFPFDPDLGGGSLPSVGYVSIPSVGIEIEERIHYAEHIDVDISRHPDADSRGSYLNVSPYSEYYVYYPPFGRIQLDASVVANGNVINLDVWVDMFTGGGMLQIKIDGVVLSTISAQIGQAFQYSATNTKGYSPLNIPGNYSSAFGAATSGDIAGTVLGAIGGSVSAISDAIAGRIPQSTSVGGMGGAEMLEGEVYVQFIFHEIVDDDNTNNGSPLCSTRTISSLPGYILPKNPDVDMNGTLAEKNQVIQTMTGGFYYE